jgi:hypothetical protein
MVRLLKEKFPGRLPFAKRSSEWTKAERRILALPALPSKKGITEGAHSRYFHQGCKEATGWKPKKASEEQSGNGKALEKKQKIGFKIFNDSANPEAWIWMGSGP